MLPRGQQGPPAGSSAGDQLPFSRCLLLAAEEQHAVVGRSLPVQHVPQMMPLRPQRSGEHPLSRAALDHLPLQDPAQTVEQTDQLLVAENGRPLRICGKQQHREPAPVVPGADMYRGEGQLAFLHCVGNGPMKLLLLGKRRLRIAKVRHPKEQQPHGRLRCQGITHEVQYLPGGPGVLLGATHQVQRQGVQKLHAAGLHAGADLGELALAAPLLQRLQCTLDGLLDHIMGGRLQDVVKAPQAHAGLGVFELGVAGQKHHQGLRIQRPHLPCQLQPIPSRHLDIAEQQLCRGLRQHCQGGIGAGSVPNGSDA